jgi:hypothetical protein
MVLIISKILLLFYLHSITVKAFVIKTNSYTVLTSKNRLLSLPQRSKYLFVSKEENNIDHESKKNNGDKCDDLMKDTLMISNDNEIDTNPNSARNLVASEEITKSNNNPKSTSDSISYKVFMLVSYITQFLGFYFFCGLILNLFGYGYSFDFEQGIKIETIQNMRNEREFKYEMERMSLSKPKGNVKTNEQFLRNSVAPPSELPR